MQTNDRVDKGIFYGSWCKLLADIYSVSRNEIEQRDKKRNTRARLVRGIIVSAIILVLSVMLIYALISRQRAIEHRQLADEPYKDLM